MKRLFLTTVPVLLLVLVLGACAPAPTEETAETESVDTFENAGYSRPLDDTEAATLTLTLSTWDTTISALDDSDMLIDAEFDFVGEMVFDITGIVEKEIIIEQNNEDIVYEGDEEGQWQIAISPDVTTRYTINGSLATLEADLSELDVAALTLDMSTGDTTIQLPPREDGIALEFSGSLGALDVSIPEGTPIITEEPVSLSLGTTTLSFGEGASWGAQLVMSTGNFVLDVAEDAAVRVTITDASVGTFDPQIEMTQVEQGDSDGTGVWETPDYADADAQIDISVEMSIGDLIVR